MKQRYQSPAWISGAMDDAGLTPHEFRVLAHVCRRAGDGSNGRGCDASISSMAEACRIDPDRLRQMLKKLVGMGWLEATSRLGKPTEYRPAFPANSQRSGGDPSPETGGVQADPSLDCPPLPLAIAGGDPLAITGAKGNPLREPTKGTREDTDCPASRCGTSPHPAAGVSMPHAGPRACDRQEGDAVGTGDASPSTYVPEVFEEDARKWAIQIHESEGRSSDSALAMFPPEEVETWAVDWLVTMQARGWRLDGAPVANPRAALRGYLRKAAVGRSKRFREVSRGAGGELESLSD